MYFLIQCERYADWCCICRSVYNGKEKYAHVSYAISLTYNRRTWDYRRGIHKTQESLEEWKKQKGRKGLKTVQASPSEGPEEETKLQLDISFPHIQGRNMETIATWRKIQL